MDATTSIVNGNPPFEGDYIPQGNNNNNYGIENFDNLIGESANGIWTLLIRDDAWLISGSLNSWSLDFTCEDNCEDNLYNFSLSTDGWGNETSFSLNDNNGLEIFFLFLEILLTTLIIFMNFALKTVVMN